jgi:hypothetical protein
LLFVCFACGTNNRPVSDTQKEKIVGEVKEIVHNVFKGAEAANFDMVVDTWYDSPDFVYMCNGKTYNYKECMDEMKQFLNVLLNQKCTIVDEKYAVLDNSTVLGTINTKWLMNYKDGHSVLQDPWAVQFTFRKIDSRWKVIYHVESGAEKNVISSESSKGLNQVELWKKFSGTWKGEIAKDTFIVYDNKPYGTGMESNIKIVTKGKTVQEGKGLFGYNKESDKIFEAMMLDGYSIVSNAYMFTSENTCEGIPVKDISKPEDASLKWKIEFKSTDIWVVASIKDNKTIETDTLYRVGK